MEFLKVAAVLAVVALVALAVFFMVRSDLRGRKQRGEEARRMGFQPVDRPEPELIERVARLHPRNKLENLKLQNVYRKAFPDGQLYLFDLIDAGGNETSTLAEGAVAVASRWLDLPDFILFPRVPGEGFLSNAGNRLMQAIFERFGQPVELDDEEFARRFMLIGEDEAAVKRLFTFDVLRLLCQKGNHFIQAGGDTIVVSPTAYSAAGNRGAPSLGERINEALDLYRMFS